MGLISFLKQTAASVPTPSAGKVSIFVDSATGEPKFKEENGLFVPLGPGLAIERLLHFGTSTVPSAQAAGTYMVSSSALISLLTASNVQHGNFYFDPADFELPGKKVKCKLRVVCMTPDTASTITHTVGVYPITAVSGETTNLVNTVGEVVAGSTVAFENQAAKTIGVKTAKGFELAKGMYAIGDLTSGINTTNCRTNFVAKLHVYWE